jgi:hypothetical protein
MKLKEFLAIVNFIPNSLFSRGKVTIPTIVSVVRNATTGTMLAPAFTRDPTSGKATKAGIKVILPTKAETIVDIRALD